MVKVTIELSVDTQNAEQLKTLVNLLQNSNEVAQAPKQPVDGQTSGAEEQPGSKAPRKPRTPKPAESQAEVQNPEPEPEPEPMDEKPDEKPKEKVITIEQVRLLLASKVSNHRQEIKDKLTELGANNVTMLELGKYQDFMAFMQNLD